MQTLSVDQVVRADSICSDHHGDDLLAAVLLLLFIHTVFTLARV
jgi:hypothetical protein